MSSDYNIFDSQQTIHYNKTEEDNLVDSLIDLRANIDETLIKESPPRANINESSPRPLGEILDEEPSPRPVTPTALRRRLSGQIENPKYFEDYYYNNNNSPLRRVSERIPSHTLNGGSREISDSMSNKIVYEKFDGIHPDQLQSINNNNDINHDVKIDEKRPKNNLVSGKSAGEGWHKSAIRWAPLNVPLQRRLQTLMVLIHTLSIIAFVTFFFFLCSIPIIWPLILPYLIYIIFSRAAISGELSYRSERLRNLPIWSLFASYFPARLHRTTVLPPTRKYLFGYHPHGIISHGAFAAFATEALGFSQLFPGIKNTLLTLDSNFRIPLYRDYALRMGLASVSRESCENILSKGGMDNEGMGRAITIVVGGARESLDAQPSSLRLVLKRRKGFIKLAIRTGADLVPVLAFGENELYEQITGDEHPYLLKGQLWMKKILGFTLPLFHARGIFNYDVGIMPYRRPLNIVVGKPILVNIQKIPEQSYIDEIHEKYIQELVNIWNEWKDNFAESELKEMEIVE